VSTVFGATISLKFVALIFGALFWRGVWSRQRFSTWGTPEVAGVRGYVITKRFRIAGLGQPISLISSQAVKLGFVR
jgi:hypothetical protein